MRIIQYQPTMKIANTQQLKFGNRFPYLEVMDSHKEGEYIAVGWRRKKPKTLKKGRSLIGFV